MTAAARDKFWIPIALLLGFVVVRAVFDWLGAAELFGRWPSILAETALFLVLVVVVLLLARRQVFRPVRELTVSLANRNVRRASGAAIEPPHVDRGDAIGALARAVAEVLSDAQTAKDTRDRAIAEEADRVVDQFQTVLDRLPVGVLIYDWEDLIALCNKPMVETLYPALSDVLQKGVPFDRVLRVSAQRGWAGPIDQPIETWIVEQLKLHRWPEGPRVVERQKGKWTEIREYRLDQGFTVAFYRDVTEVKELEAVVEQQKRQIRRQQNLLDTLLKSVDNGILLFDQSQRVEYVNPAYLGLFFTPEELIKKKAPISEIASFHGAEDEDEWKALEWRAYAKAVSDVLDRRIETRREVERPDGTVIAYQCRRFGRGGGVLLFRNATPDIALAEELPALVERLEVKQEMAKSSVAHRRDLILALRRLLRPALAQIRATAETIGWSLDSAKARTSLANLEVAIARIEAALENAANLVAIEDGEIAFEPKSYRLGDVIGGVADTFAEAIEEKELEFVCGYARGEDENSIISFDAPWFAYVLDAVIDNAVTNTKKGMIEIQVSLSRQLSRNVLRLVVADSGPGIDRERMTTLFEFVRGGDDGAADMFTETLSMPLCRAICRAMGGEIAADSKLGVGTTVTIELPVALVD